MGRCDRYNWFKGLIQKYNILYWFETPERIYPRLSYGESGQSYPELFRMHLR